MSVLLLLSSCLTTRMVGAGPVVSSLVATNSASTGAVSVTIIGSGFPEPGNPAPNTDAVMLGGTAAEASNWLSTSGLQCKTEMGLQLSSTSVAVTEGQTTGSLNNLLTVDDSFLQVPWRQNAAVTGSTSVTIVSSGGGHSASSAVRVSSSAQATAWCSATSTKAKSSSGSTAVDALSVVVTAGPMSMDSWSSIFTVDNSNVASGVAKTNTAQTGATSVTLVGSTGTGIFETTMGIRLVGSAASNTMWVSSTSTTTKTTVRSGMTTTGGAAIVTMTPSHDATVTETFSFDVVESQTISSVVQTNHPVTGATSVTIVGATGKIGVIGMTTAARLGARGTMSTSTQWISSTSVQTKSPATTKSSATVAMTTSKMLGSLTEALSLDDTLTVSSATRVNLASTGATSVTLVGNILANHAPTLSSRVGGSGTVGTMWLSSTSLLGKTSTGQYPSSGNVVASTAKQSVGTLAAHVTYDDGAVTSESPTNGAATGGMSVTLVGTIAAFATTLRTRVGGSGMESSGWTSTTSVAGKTAEGVIGGTGFVSTVSQSVGVDGTLDWMVSYTMTATSGTVKTNAVSTGSVSVTIVGASTGHVSSTQGRVGSTATTTTAWMSTSSVTGKMGGSSGAVSVACLVTGTAVVGSFTASVTYDGAAVTDLTGTVNSARTGAMSVTVVSATSSTHVTARTRIGGSVGAATTWVSSTSTMAKTIAGAHDSLSVLLTVASPGSPRFATVSPLLSFDSTPSVSIVLRTNLALTGASSVTIVGASLANVAVTSNSRMGKSGCRSTHWVSASALRCKATSALSGVASNVIATAPASSTTLIGTASFDSTLSATSAGGTNAAVTGSMSVTLVGMMGSSVPSSPRCHIGGSGTTATSWTSSTSVNSKHDRGQLHPSGLNIRVTVNSMGATLAAWATFDDITVTSSSKNSPSTGAVSVTMVGVGYPDAMDATVRGRHGGTGMHATGWLSSTTIYGKVSVGYFGAVGVQVTLMSSVGVGGTHGATMTYTATATSSVTATNAASTGATSVTLVGVSTSVHGSTNVRVAGSTSKSTLWLSTSALQVKHTASATPKIAGLLVTVGQAAGTLTMAVSFIASAVSIGANGNSARTGTMSVTVVGMSTQSLSSSIRLGGTSVVSTMWRSSTSIIAKTADGALLSNTVVASVDVTSSQSSVMTASTFDHTWGLSSSVKNNVAVTGATSVTIVGEMWTATISTPHSKVGGSRSECSIWNSLTSVVTKSQSGEVVGTSAAGIAVTAVSTAGTLTSWVSYDSAVVTSITQNVASTGAMSVTVVGQALGARSASLVVRLGATSTTGTKWMSASSVNAKSTSGSTVVNTQSVLATLATDKGFGVTLAAAASYTASALSSIVRSNVASTGATSVTLVGTGVGIKCYSQRVHEGRTSASSTMWTSSTTTHTKVCRSHGAISMPTMVTTSVNTGDTGTLTSTATFDTVMNTVKTSGNTARTGSTSVTVVGLTTALRSTFTRIGSSSTTSTIWISDTSLNTKSSGGGEAGRTVVATSAFGGNAVESIVTAATFDVTVTISSLEATNAPQSGTSSVTLVGSVWSSASTTLKGILGNSAPEVTSWVSSSSVLCKHHSTTNSAGGSTVAITVATTQGTLSHAITQDAQTTSSVLKTNIACTGATSVTIVGLNGGHSDMTMAHHIRGTSPSASTWVSLTCVRAKTFAGSSHNGIHSVVSTTSANVVNTLSNAVTTDASQLIKARPTNMPSTGSTSVTIVGLGLTTSMTSQMRIQSTATHSSRWRSSTSIQSKPPLGHPMSISGTFAIVTADRAGQTFMDPLSFAAPKPSSVVVGNVPSTGAVSATLVGISYQPTQSMKLGATAMDTMIWTSDTTIRVKSVVSTTFNAGLPIAVTATTVTATTLAMVTIDNTASSSIIRGNAPATGATSVTLVGSLLGVGHSPHMRITSTQACGTTWLASTTIKSKTVHRPAISAAVSLSSFRSATTHSPAITFVRAESSSPLQANGPTTGSVSVTLVGSSVHHMTALIRAGGTLAKVSTWVSESSLRLKATFGAGSSLQLVLTSVASVSLTRAYTLNAPNPSGGVKVNAPASGATSVTVIGSSAGAFTITNRVRIGNSASEGSRWGSDSSLTTRTSSWNVRTIALAGLAVTTASATGSISDTITFPLASIAHSQYNSAATGAITVTLIATNAGFIQETMSVQSGGTAAEATTWLSDTNIVIKSVSGTYTSFNVGATMPPSLTRSTIVASLTFDAPQLSGIARTNQATTGATSVTIVGHNYGPHMTVTGRHARSGSTSTLWVADSAVFAKQSHGLSGTPGVTITAIRFALTLTQPLSVDNYARLSSMIRGNIAATGATSVTLVGVTLGQYDRSPRARVDTTHQGCTLWASSTTVSSQTHGGVTPSSTNQFVVSLGVSNNPYGSITQLTSFDSPTTSSVKRANKPCSGSLSVTLIGAGFGRALTSIATKIRKTSVMSTRWVADTSMKTKPCLTLSGAQSLVITLIPVLATTTRTFSSDRLQLSSLLVGNSPLTGSSSVTVLGATTLEPSRASNSFRISQTTAQTTAWASSTSVAAKYLSSSILSTFVCATVDIDTLLVGTLTAMWTINHAHASAVHRNVATTGAQSVTVVGINYNVHRSSPGTRVGNTKPSTSVWVADTSLMLKSPFISSKSQGVTVTLYVRQTSMSSLYSFDTLAASGLLPSNAPSTSASSVTIVGVVLSHRSSPKGRFGASGSEVTSWVSVSSILSKTNTRGATALDFGLSVLQHSHYVPLTAASALSLAIVDASSLLRSNIPVTSGLSVTVLGIGFVHPSSRSRVVSTGVAVTLWGSESSVLMRTAPMFGNQPCFHTTTTFTELRTLTRAITVDSGFRSIVPVNVASSGSMSVTVLGVGLGATFSSHRMRFGYSVAASTLWISDTAALGRVVQWGERLVASLRLVATVNGVTRDTATNALSYPLPTPILTHFNSPTTGATYVTILVASAGFTDTTDTLKVAMGGTASEASNWLSDTNIFAKRSFGYPRTTHLATTMVSNKATLWNAVTFDDLHVSSAVHVNQPATGSTSVTVVGIKTGSLVTSRIRTGGTSTQSSRWMSESSITGRHSQGWTNLRVVVGATSVKRVSSRTTAFTIDWLIHPSSMIHMNLAASGGVSVTVIGLTMGTNKSTRRTRIGLSGAITSTWISDTGMRSKVVMGHVDSLSLDIAVTVYSNALQSITKPATYDHVTLSSAMASNVAGSGATSITVLGHGIRHGKGTIRARVHSTALPGSVWASMTAIWVKAPLANSGAVSLIVSLNDLRTSTTHMLSVDTSCVSAVHTTNAHATGAMSVTLVGSNLAAVLGTAKSRIGRTGVHSSHWVSSTTILSKRVHGLFADRAAHKLAITLVDGHESTLTSSLSFVKVMPTSASPNFPASGATYVTMVGISAATVGFSERPRMQGTRGLSTLWFADTALRSKVGASVASGAPLAVTTIGYFVTLTRGCTFDTTVLSAAIQRNAPATASASVTVMSRFQFEAQPSSNIRIARTSTSATVWRSDSSVIAKASMGLSVRLLSIQVTGLRRAASITRQFSYTMLEMSDTVVTNVPISASISVTVLGLSNLLPRAQLSVVMRIAASHAMATKWSSGTSVTTKTIHHTAATYSTAAIFITAAAQHTLSWVLTYDVQVMSTVLPNNGPSSGAASVTVVGSSVNVRSSHDARIGMSSTAASTWGSDSSLHVKASVFSGVCLSVSTSTTKVKVATVTSLWTVDAITISSIVRVNNPASGSNSLTLVGANNGVLSPLSARASVGGTALRATDWNSNSAVLCKMPHSVADSLLATVTIGSVGGSLTTAWSTDRPQTSTAILFNVPSTGATYVTLLGSGYALSESAATQWVRNQGSACEAAAWRSSSSILLKSSRGLTLPLVKSWVGVSVVRQFATLSTIASYTTLRLSSLAAANVPSSGSISLTLVGQSTGHVSTAAVRLGHTAPQSSIWQSDSAVACKAASATAATTWSLVTTIASMQDATMTKQFTIDRSTLSSTAPTNVAATGAMSVTLIGTTLVGYDATLASSVGTTATEAAAWLAASALRVKAPLAWHPGFHQQVTIAKHSATLLAAVSIDIAHGPVSVHPSNAAVSGSSSVTIIGSSFAVRDSTVAVRHGGSRSTATAWASSTHMLAKTSGGVGARHGVTSTILLLVLTSSRSLTFDSTILSSLVRTNAPNTGSSSLTVVSGNMATQDYTGVGRIGTTATEVGLWVCESSMRVKIASGVSFADKSVITVSNQVGTLIAVLTTDDPRLETIQPTDRHNTPTSGSASVTLLGMHFGYVGTSPRVRLGETSSMATRWITETSLWSKDAPGIGHKMRRGIVTVGFRLGSVSRLVTFDHGSPSGVKSSNIASTGGVSLTMIGSQLGASDSSVDVHIGGTGSEVATWRSESSIHLKAARGLLLGLHIAVSVVEGGHSLSRAISFNSIEDVWDMQRTNIPSTSSASVTVTGTDFGFTDHSTAARMHRSRAESMFWVSETAVTAKSCSVAGVRRSVVMTAGLHVKTLTRSWTTDLSLSSSLRTNVPLTGGCSLTIHGMGFGETTQLLGPTLDVRVGATGAEAGEWVSETSIRGKVGRGRGLDQAIQTTVSMQVETLTVVMTYSGFDITSIQQRNGPTSGAVSVTLWGIGFGSAVASHSSRLAETSMDTTVWISSSDLRCKVHVGAGVRRSTVATVALYRGSGSTTFTFASNPTLQTVRTNTPLSGSVSTTIIGNGFGSADVTPLSRLHGTAAEAGLWICESSMRSKAPHGHFGMIHFTASVQSVPGTSAISHTHDGPHPNEHAVKGNSPATGSVTVSIAGGNFGAYALSVAGCLSRSSVVAVSWASDSTVYCKTDAGRQSSGAVRMSVFGSAVGRSVVASTRTKAFSYDILGVSSVVSSRLARGATGGSFITIVGHNDGGNDYSPRGGVGKTSCEHSDWVAGTTVRCKLSAGTAIPLGVLISVEVNVRSTLSRSFTYEHDVSSVLPTNMASSGSTSVTVYGTSFGLHSVRTTPSIRMASSTSEVTHWLSASSVTTKVGASIQRRIGRTVLTAALERTSHTKLFTIDLLKLTDATPNNLPPATGALSITLHGSGFGDHDSSPVALIGDTVCESTRWFSATTIGVKSPAGTPLYMTGVTASMVNNHGFEHILGLPISETSPSHTTTTGAVSVTLLGANYGTVNSPTATATQSGRSGVTACEAMAWVSFSSMTCKASSGSTNTVDFVVSARQKKGTLVLGHTFFAPAVSGVTVTNVPITGAVSVSLAGSGGFGPFSTGLLGVGGTGPQATTWLSDTSICGRIEPMALKRAVVVASVVLQKGSLSHAFSFTDPTATSLILTNGLKSA